METETGVWRNIRILIINSIMNPRSNLDDQNWLSRGSNCAYIKHNFPHSDIMIFLQEDEVRSALNNESARLQGGEGRGAGSHAALAPRFPSRSYAAILRTAVTARHDWRCGKGSSFAYIYIPTFHTSHSLFNGVSTRLLEWGLVNESLIAADIVLMCMNARACVCVSAFHPDVNALYTVDAFE